MTNDELENNDNNPDLTFDYKGNLFIVLAWLIWSIVGFVYLVVISKTESPFMEVFYVLSAILSVNALNNRKYGVNHSIRFYSEYVILPKVMGPWMFKEEKIFYRDIQEINLIDYGENTSKDFFEIELLTEDFSYPIFGKKLILNDLKQVYAKLCEKTKVRQLDFPEIEEEGSFDYSEKNQHDRPKWKGYLALLALIVSGWTILGISLSTPYSNLLNGGKIFLTSFLISIIGTFLLAKKFNNGKNEQIKKWQKIFLLGYIGLYGGIALTFSLVYLNGKFDSSAGENLMMKIVSSDSTDSKKGPCFRLKVDSKGRTPSSTETSIMQFGELHICSNSLKGASVGENYILKSKSGLFNEKWVFDIAKKSNLISIK